MNKFSLTSFTMMVGLLLMTAAMPLSARTLHLENQIVEQLDIELSIESTDASAASVRARLKTKQGALFSQNDFDADLKMLAQDYDRIEPYVETKEGKVYVTLKIWPNPTIRKIVWEGTHRISTKKLQAELGIAPGTAFDRLTFNKAFNNLKTYYIKKGFFEAELNFQVVFDEASNAADIVISVCEGRSGKIKKIVFRNFSKREEEELLCLMVTKNYNLFLSWLSGTGIYNEEMIQHDKFQVLNYLQNEGYADACVDFQITESKQENRIIICITADRGQRYYFDAITIEGNTLFTDKELLECLPITKGTPFSPEKIQQSLRILTNYYGRQGYIETSINYVPRLIDGCLAYSVNISVEEGDQYYVGMIKVMGNPCTQTKVILHETLLIPGEVFNLEKLQATERRLTNIGYFECVNVYAVKSEDAGVLPGCYRDVHIEVAETSTGNLGAFFGFSSVENIFGGINLTERNFNYKGLGRVWRDGLGALRGGGEYAHITLSFGAKSSTYSFSWTKPYFMDTPWSVGFDIDRSWNEYYSDHYSIYGTGLTLHATYECNAFTRIGTHYRLSYTDVDQHHGYNEIVNKDQWDGLISAVGYSWQYNTTNSSLNPTCGIRSIFNTEVAGIGGDVGFLSFGYNNSYFYALGHTILKLRGDIRFIQPLGGMTENDIPLDERFFLGGDTLVRGYRAYRLGPKYIVIDKEGKRKRDEEDPKGGISMQFLSLELSRPVFACADAFAFIDGGAVSSRRWNFGRFNFSAGVGARLKLLAGTPPLMVGYGWPLNPADDSDVKQFFITVGGKF